MRFDLVAAVRFVGTHGRVLERRRLQLLLGGGPAEPVLAALDSFGNSDGGYGWGLEPDLRSVTSQPVAAMHALEVLAEVGGAGGDRATRLFDWLGGHTLADGGVPFAVPYPDVAGSAPHWVSADPAVSSLMMTAQLAAQAHRLDAAHPWLAGATAYCLDALESLGEPPSAMELMFVLRFLDAVAGREPRARALVDRFAGHVTSPMPVEGGADGEVLHLLDFSPEPGAYSREVFTADAVAADLERLAGQQQADGGWPITFDTFSPAAALEWRGYATVQAIAVLRRGRMSA